MAVVTIIVPVYNVERYLRRCLDSVLAQTFIDWECVIVDDGSPDGCPAICDEYAARDRRFRVIHKPRNEGLPAARMTGLSVVKTEYVMHLDSDDWLEKIALELLIKKAGESKAKIVIGNFNRITHSKIIRMPHSLTHCTEMSASITYVFQGWKLVIQCFENVI